jgi:U4/U6 small nuclear ribonucleoprotein PRP31
MSALADELLADLDGLSEGGDYSDTEDPPAGAAASVAADVDMSDDEGAGGSEGAGEAALVLVGGVRPAEELDAEDVQQMELGTIADVATVAKLEGSKRMSDILKVCYAVYTAPLHLVLILHRKSRSMRRIPRRQHRCLSRHTRIQSIA